jgi:hypothetical protein
MGMVAISEVTDGVISIVFYNIILICCCLVQNICSFISRFCKKHGNLYVST